MIANKPTGEASRVPARAAIAHVLPEIDGGQFPIKRIEGETVEASADVFADGHGVLSAVLRYRREGSPEWLEAPMEEAGNDRWVGRFAVGNPGSYEYTFQAWLDDLKTWRRDLAKRIEAAQDVSVDLEIGAGLIEACGSRASAAGSEYDARRLRQWARAFRSESPLPLLLNQDLWDLALNYPDRRAAATYEKCLRVTVDRRKSRFSSWYEMFPRSWDGEPGRHGTLRDCESALPYIAAMGFDVLYFPPIHPIGLTSRKGKNNQPRSTPDDVGSPWAIGAVEGGHKSVHPELGTIDDFDRFFQRTRECGLEVALDLAYQCSPDHPYVESHPGWFLHRPDGSIQYAENPPKKYEDIYPLDFECQDWQALWQELRSIVFFWIERGVRIFRVDNPHTKPFVFWEWMIHDVKKEYPEVIFLSEAFTRPQVMQRLAKVGFSQSYTYFAWRNTKEELTEYFTELTQTGLVEYFRPSLWPNTPDILTGYLQSGGRPAFISRLVLAATLGASYGIYGPAFELCENRALVPGSEEYLDAEKYQLRKWDLESAGSIKEVVALVNRARHENPALQRNAGLRFHRLDNDQLIAYTKANDDRSNVLLMVVNLDPRYTQSGWVEVPWEEFGIDSRASFPVDDRLTGARYFWSGRRNYVQLDPHAIPAHVFRIKPRP